MIRMQPYVIAALARHYGLRRSALSRVLFDEIQDAAYAAQVGAWYESLPANNRLGQQHLAALAAPDLLADVRILHGRERLTRFLLLAQLESSGGACVLAGLQADGELELRPVEGVEAVSDSVLLMLAADSEPTEPEMNVRLSHAELAALLAWLDLEARAAFVSLIAHQPRPEVFQAQDIADYCSRESNAPDPRWLLPFLAPLLDPEAVTTAAQQTANVLQALTRRGLVEPRGEGWAWTLPGQFLSESFHRRIVTATIDTAGAGPDGALGRHSCCLLRSDQPLWLIDIPPDGEATLAGISILDARKVLDTVLTPTAKAPAWPPPRPQPVQYPAASPPAYAPAPQHAAPPPPVYAQPPQYTAPPAQPVAAPPPPAGAPAMKYCSNCGQALPASAAFCGYCGARQM